MDKCFLSEVIDGAQSVKTKTGKKERNVCCFRSGNGREDCSEGGAGRCHKATRGCPGGLGKPAASFVLAPRVIGNGSPPTKPSHTEESHFLCCQTGKQSEQKES